jgi:DNA mismatch repair protein MLH3
MATIHTIRSRSTTREVLARHTPALAEQRLLNFSHGTRVSVRDLLGLMSVRVKQRAIDVARGPGIKDWEHLICALTALMLA